MLGWVGATTDPLEHQPAPSFDAASRPIAMIDPLGNINTSVFDAASRLVASVNPLGKK